MRSLDPQSPLATANNIRTGSTPEGSAEANFFANILTSAVLTIRTTSVFGEALPQEFKIIVGRGQYRNAVASGRSWHVNIPKKLSNPQITRRYRVTVLAPSKSEL
jgi:hypothetical protein